MPISLNPDTFVSGAIIDNVNATLIRVRYGRFTYPGTSTTVVAALGYLMVDGDSQEHEQPWSIGGKPEDWIISEDGRFIESATGKSALQNNANLTMFLQELVNGGFPKNKLDNGDIGVLDGLYGHWVQKAGSGTNPKTGKPYTYLITDRITKLPWENKGTAARGVGAAGKPAVAGAAAKPAGTPAGRPKANGAPAPASTDIEAAKADADAVTLATEILHARANAMVTGEGLLTDPKGNDKTGSRAHMKLALIGPANKYTGGDKAAFKAHVVQLLDNDEWVMETVTAAEAVAAVEGQVEVTPDHIAVVTG